MKTLTSAFLGLVALALVLTTPAPAYAQFCGDMDGSGLLDISDMVYLLNYMYMDGPPPVNMADANTDGCDGIDLGDFQCLLEYLFMGGPMPDCTPGPHCTPTMDSLTFIEVAAVDGLVGPGVIAVGQPVTFHFRLANYVGTSMQSLSAGFSISSGDGATWDNITADTVPGALSSYLPEFNHIYGPTTYGSGVDTVGFAHAGFFGPGLPPVYDEIVWSITIGPFDAGDAGKTITLDTSFFGNGGTWMWYAGCKDGYKPAWGGPYVYTIAEEPDAAITLEAVDGELMPGVVRNFQPSFDFRATNNSGEDVLGVSNGFHVYSPDGAVWDSITGTPLEALDTSFFDAGIFINYFGDTVGFGAVAIFGTGWPSPYTAPMCRITVHGMGVDSDGRTICIDSTWYPPGNTWLWGTSTGSIPPEWYGPYCWTVQYVGDGGYMQTTPEWLSFTATQGVNPSPQSFQVYDSLGANYGYLASEGAGWMNTTMGIGIVPDSVVVTVDVGGLAPGYYIDSVTLTSLYAANSPVYVPVELTVLPVGGADSLIVPSIAGHLGHTVQPVDVKLSQPIKGAAIPLAIPTWITVDSITFDGLITEDWDYTTAYARNDSGFAFIALANSLGEVIPTGQTTVAYIHHHGGGPYCFEPWSIQWDTTLYEDPTRHLLFADINNQDLPAAFDVNRDQTSMPGYVPGDYNGDQLVNITDLTAMPGWMFDGYPPPVVMDAFDVNGSCTGPNIADLTYFVDFMFQGGDPLQCGCLFDGAAAKAIGATAQLETVYDNGVTTIRIETPVALRGLELEVNDVISKKPVSLLGSGFDIYYSEDESSPRIGVIDMEGEQMMFAGEYAVIQLEGYYTVMSALGSDEGHNEVAFALSGEPQVPMTYSLDQNYPNPFNPATEISFSLKEAGRVTLTVYDITGRTVTTLVDGYRAPGPHTVQWNGCTASGESVASGVYFYRLEAGAFSATKKMMLLK